MSSADADDRLLVQRVIRDRDERAFADLYDRHTPYLYRLALRLTGGDETASEDIVHDVWILAATRLDAFGGGSRLRTWLAGFVLNVARAGARRGQAMRFIDETSADDEPPLSCQHERIDLERALAALSPGFREVIVLHDVEGYTHEEIAGMLDIQPGTSKSQLSRARAAMRRLLHDRSATPTRD